VEQVQAGLRTLAATVNNVLHFHSLPAPNRVPTDLGRLLDWAGGFLLPLARQARVELCLRNRLEGVFFPADRHRLEQVLLNLFLNGFAPCRAGAGSKSPDSRSITGRRGRCRFAVSDTDRELRRRKRPRYSNPGSARAPAERDWGWQCGRKIAEQHGGSLAAGNRAGMGACFTLTFPLPEEFRQEVAG